MKLSQAAYRSVWMATNLVCSCLMSIRQKGLHECQHLSFIQREKLLTWCWYKDSRKNTILGSWRIRWTKRWWTCTHYRRMITVGSRAIIAWARVRHRRRRRGGHVVFITLHHGVHVTGQSHLYSWRLQWVITYFTLKRNYLLIYSIHPGWTIYNAVLWLDTQLDT